MYLTSNCYKCKRTASQKFGLQLTSVAFNIPVIFIVLIIEISDVLKAKIIHFVI